MLENFNSHGPAGLIEKSQLTIEKLQEIFRAAYMKPETDPQGSLVIRGRTRIRYTVQVRERQGIIAIGCAFRFRDGAENTEKLEALNKLNDGKVMARFSVTRRGIPVCRLSYTNRGRRHAAPASERHYPIRQRGHRQH